MSKRCRFIVYGLVLMAITLLVFFLLCMVHHFGIFKPRFTLLGEKTQTIALHETYKEKGYEVYYRFKNYTDEVEISGNVEEAKIGEYSITYYVPSLNIREKRIVQVCDQKKPVLTLLGDKTVYTFVGQTFQDEKVQAFDDCDGDITKNVKVNSNVDLQKAGTYTIVYTSKDKAGNVAKLERKVIVKEDPMKTTLSYHYADYDNTAMQWWFKKSKDHARNEAAIDQNTLKSFASYYIGEDEKVIYLTFDEGGSERTYIKEIAHLLNRYEIQGTFFLTRNYILNEADFIRDLVANGHVVGNHTHNHLNMCTLANEAGIKKFSEEITAVEKAYMQVTGKEMIKVFRFPKGEASERTMKMVADMGYRTYFWSHAYYDYGETLSFETAYNHMMNYYHNGAIYLMHPNNKGNYDALESFIKEMLDMGYTFKTVDQIK